jgi:ABC-type lipoprotein release transport system permease subunit
VDGERGLVLGFLLARSMDLEIGDSVILLSSDYYGSQAADRYRLVGTLELGVTEFDQSLALLPLAEIQQFLDYGDRVSHVALFAEQSEQTETIAADASSIFDDDYEVVPWATLMPDFAQLITLDDVANRLSLAILILVAGFGLLNTVLMTVLERVHEFGLMRAIGAKPRTLFLSVMLEASLLALIGIAAGVLVAIPLVLYMEGHPIPLTGIGAEAMELFSVDPLLSFELQRKNLIGSSSIMFVVALMAALPPAWRASRGAPVDVMRSVRA